MNIYDSSGKTVLVQVTGDYFYDSTNMGQPLGRMSGDYFYNNTGQQMGYVKDGNIYDKIGNIIGKIRESCHPRFAGGAALFLLLPK